jgi:hypothetical protein
MENLGRFIYLRVTLAIHTYWHAKIKKKQSAFGECLLPFFSETLDFSPLFKYLKIKILKIILLLCASRELCYWSEIYLGQGADKNMWNKQE